MNILKILLIQKYFETFESYPHKSMSDVRPNLSEAEENIAMKNYPTLVNEKDDSYDMYLGWNVRL